jgi:hypothetical protein
MALLQLLQQYARERIHILGAIDHHLFPYKIISIELLPFKSYKYTHFQVRLYHKETDQYGYPIKREDIPFQEGQLVWRKDIEYMKWNTNDGDVVQTSWVRAISEIIKVQIKKETDWETIPWDGQECAVCYRNWGVDTSLPCGHVFCKKCIMKWSEHSNTCPCCRRKFKIKFT